MGDRQEIVFHIWRRVNELAIVEDTNSIRAIIGEAAIEPGTHVGVAPEDFTPLMIGEWVLGNWADVIDSGQLWALNTARNVSLHQYGVAMAMAAGEAA